MPTAFRFSVADLEEMLAEKVTPLITAGGVVVVSYMSAPINVATLGAAVALCPAIPGYYAHNGQIQGIVKTAGGVMATPPSAKIGNNVAHDNWLAAGTNVPITVAAHTAGVLTPGPRTLVLSAAAKPLIDMAAPPFLEITVAATGGVGFAATVRIVSLFALVPIANF